MRQARTSAIKSRLESLAFPMIRIVLRQGALVCALALCAAAPLMGRWHPFGLAMALVALRAGVHPLWVLAGTAGGRLLVGDGWSAIQGASALAVLCLGTWAVRSRNWPKTALYGLFAFCWIMPYIALGWRTPYDALMGAMEILCSMLMLWVFNGTRRALGDAARILTEEERILCLVTAGVLVLGLGNIQLGPVSPMWVGAAVLGLICAQIGGAGAGAAAGLGLGAMIALGTAPSVWGTMNLALCAVAAGALRTLKRWAMVLAFVTTLTVALLLEGGGVGFSLYDALAAGALFLLLPTRLMEMLRTRFIGVAQEERSALHVKQALRGRMEAFGGALHAMGEAFARAGVGDTSPAVEALLHQVCRRCCADCTLRVSCWQHDYDHTFKQLGGAMARARERGRFSRGDLPPGIARRCLRVDRLAAAMNDTLYAMELDALGKRWLEEDRRMLSEQLLGMAAVVAEVGAQLDLSLRTDEHRARAVRAVLEQEGVRVEDAQVQAGEEGMLLRLSVSRCKDCTRCEKLTPRICSAVGRRMERVTRCPPAREKQCDVGFVEGGALRTNTGIANFALNGISGDSTMVRPLSGTRRIAALSDGMGAGARASEESASVLELVSRFYEAGFGREVTLRAINQIMRLRSGTDMFATLDLMLVDVKMQVAEIIKVGAPMTLHISGERVDILQGDAPPIGILEQVEPVIFRRNVQAGDVIIMASDGVTDRLGDQFAEIAQVIANTERDPQRIADTLLLTARQVDGEEDDMTVLVTRMEAENAP